MAETTWKQAVYDIADAYREAEGTTDKISIANLKEKVREGSGLPYTGPNPLTIGADGYSFDPKTLLKDGLTIVNGVEGEDLTATEADMALAITELQRMVARKISENRGEGACVWKKLTAEGGELVNYVINDDETAYPDSGTQDGYYYIKYDPTVNIPENIRENINNWGVLGAMSEGVSGIDYGIITLTNNQASLTINHNLGVVPTTAVLIPYSDANNSINSGGVYLFIHSSRPIMRRSNYNSYVNQYGYTAHSITGTYSEMTTELNYYGTRTNTDITFTPKDYGATTIAYGTYMWLAIA